MFLCPASRFGTARHRSAVLLSPEDATTTGNVAHRRHDGTVLEVLYDVAVVVCGVQLFECTSLLRESGVGCRLTNCARGAVVNVVKLSVWVLTVRSPLGLSITSSTIRVTMVRVQHFKQANLRLGHHA